MRITCRENQLTVKQLAKQKPEPRIQTKSNLISLPNCHSVFGLISCHSHVSEINLLFEIVYQYISWWPSMLKGCGGRVHLKHLLWTIFVRPGVNFEDVETQFLVESAW